MNKIALACGLAVVLVSAVSSVRAAGASLPAAESGRADIERTARELVERSGVQGGLIVHLDAGDGRLTAALRIGENWLVHGLERDAARRDQAREYVRARGAYGPVSVGAWNGADLPYAENLVNLIVADQPGDVTMDEILRVLAPRGVAMLKRDGQWTKTVKPWPETIDEWTHYLHGPSNNAVADDALVGPPQRLQWIGPPRWARSNEHLATLSAAV